MNAKSLFSSAPYKAPAAPEDSPAWGGKAESEPVDPCCIACCCPATPVVRVIIPPGPSRQHPTELLLCGHHYRVSRAALRAARAVVRELPGTPPDIASWAGVDAGPRCPA